MYLLKLWGSEDLSERDAVAVQSLAFYGLEGEILASDVKRTTKPLQVVTLKLLVTK